MKNYPELYLTIWRAVKGVRKGHVATYGQIAQICNLRGHARLVGYALHSLPPNSGVPWHRIVNSKGMISLPVHTGGYHRQRKLLEAEGIVFKDGKVDLARYGDGGIPAVNIITPRKAQRAKRGHARKRNPT